MNAKQLHLEDGTLVQAWRCSICGLIYSEKEPYTSEWCCKCHDCGTIIDPKVTGARASLCRKCWGPHYEKIDNDRLEKAVEIPDYDGPVICGDDYYETVDDLIESYDHEDDAPEFAHTCDVRHYTLDLADCLQNLIENAGVEDISSNDFVGLDKLQKAVDEFNDANKSTVYWEQDFKHKVKVRAQAKRQSDAGTGGEGE